MNEELQEIFDKIVELEEAFWFDIATMSQATKDNVLAIARKDLAEIVGKFSKYLKSNAN